MTTLIITAAGKASRFHDVGYDLPKYLLPWINGKTILNNLISEICSSGDIDYVLIIANQREKFFKSKIEEELPEEIESDILFVRDTLGQAHTTLLGVEELIRKNIGDQAIIVQASDTILKNRDIKNLTNFTDDIVGYVDTFQSSNPQYSYVLESNGFLKRFLEKSIISPIASSSLISFYSAEQFLKIYNHYASQIDNKSECYMSKLIDCSTMNGDLYKINYNSEIENTIVLGTPEEYCMAYTISSAGIKGI